MTREKGQTARENEAPSQFQSTPYSHLHPNQLGKDPRT